MHIFFLLKQTINYLKTITRKKKEVLFVLFFCIYVSFSFLKIQSINFNFIKHKYFKVGSSLHAMSSHALMYSMNIYLLLVCLFVCLCSRKFSFLVEQKTL